MIQVKYSIVNHTVSFYLIFIFFISWRLITLQYCSGFCHTLTWISHGYTCIPHPDPPSHHPLHRIPLITNLFRRFYISSNRFGCLCWPKLAYLALLGATGSLTVSLLKNSQKGTSLVVQWLRIHLVMHGTGVWFLVGKYRSHMPWSN